MTWHYNKTNRVDIVLLGKKSLQEFRVNSQKQQQQKNVSWVCTRGLVASANKRRIWKELFSPVSSRFNKSTLGGCWWNHSFDCVISPVQDFSASFHLPQWFLPGTSHTSPWKLLSVIDQACSSEPEAASLPCSIAFASRHASWANHDRYQANHTTAHHQDRYPASSELDASGLGCFWTLGRTSYIFCRAHVGSNDGLIVHRLLRISRQSQQSSKLSGHPIQPQRLHRACRCLRGSRISVVWVHFILLVVWAGYQKVLALPLLVQQFYQPRGVQWDCHGFISTGREWLCSLCDGYRDRLKKRLPQRNWKSNFWQGLFLDIVLLWFFPPAIHGCHLLALW